MKKANKFFILLISLLLVIGLVACSQKPEDTNEDNKEQHVHSYTTETTTKEATYNSEGQKKLTCSCGEFITQKIDAITPTAKNVSDGVKMYSEEESKNYDFNITFNGDISLYGTTVSADGIYDGKYRYNAKNGNLSFYRNTSGKLLYPGKEYIYTEGDNKIKIKANKDNVVKKVYLINNNEELDLINIPFVGLVEQLGEANLRNVKRDSSKTGYSFSSELVITSEYPPLQKVLSKVSLLGSNISIKNVSFVNPQGGVKLYFNLTDDGKLNGFAYGFNISFPVSGQNVSISINYSQKDSTTTISRPDISRYVSSESDKTSAINTLNAAIAAIRNSNSYSLDFMAKNDFDPGWNKMAIVDKYVSRMYKNTNDDRVDFNYSYMFKAHTEEDGAENYKYTIGNIQDGSIYKISRKGSNTQTLLEDVSINDYFDINLTGLNFDTNSLDMINITSNNDGSKTYKLFIKNNKAIQSMKDIVKLLNSNEEDEIVNVENYLDENNYNIEDYECSYTIKDGKLVSFNLDTEIRYTPTDGEYQAGVVVLKNSISLSVNNNIDKATEYVAPENVNTTIGKKGLNNSKFYIL